MLVSVIVPNYNHSKYLNQRIDSILSQSYQNFELIILDDKSKDNSSQIIEQYRDHPKVSHIVLNEVNSGSTFKQWKKGIDLAKGEYIWIAESDDFANPIFLETLTTEINKDKAVVLAYCASALVNEESVEIGREGRVRKQGGPAIYKSNGIDECINEFFFHPIIPNASAVLFKKESYYKMNNDFLDFKICGDWLFWINICLDGNIVYFYDALSYFRQSSTSVSRSNSHNQNARKTFLTEKQKIASKLVQAIKPFPLSNRLDLLVKDWMTIFRELFKGNISFNLNEAFTLIGYSIKISALAPFCILFAPMAIGKDMLQNLFKSKTKK